MCDHINKSPIRATKEVAGLVFSYETLACNDCGAVLWSQKTEEEFGEWLLQQRKENADKFVIQKVKIADDLADFAKLIARRHYRSESDVYQACVALYFSFRSRSPEIFEEIERLSIDDGAVQFKKFRVNPGLFVKIDGAAKAFDMYMNEVASWAVQKVLKAAKQGYEMALLQIERILEAA